MRFLIISGAYHYKKNGLLYAYGPYVREMNIWISQVDEVVVMCELHDGEPAGMDIPYEHAKPIKVVGHKGFEFTSAKASIRSVALLPLLIFRMIREMWLADHIHFRGPASIALIATFVQILFPWKKKTMKYAGNWDWHFPAPFSYKLQKRIPNNTWLTHNIKVLVYGSWPYRSKNILPFFTATYREHEKVPVSKDWNVPPVFMFSGVLEEHKQPLVAYQMFKTIAQAAEGARMVFCGGGYLQPVIEQMAAADGLAAQVLCTGSIPKDEMKRHYQSAHFLLFQSKSEGWPKAVAESMFWGAIPVTREVSIVPEMLGLGERGILTKPNDAVAAMAERVLALWNDKAACQHMSALCMEWSRQFTLDKFEADLKKLI